MLHLLFRLTPPPPTSTLFPYTTLFRSHSWPARTQTSTSFPKPSGSAGSRLPSTIASSANSASARTTWRSEEHTSELQSRGHLVCRLLLEKKNMREHIDLMQSHAPVCQL